MRGPDTTQHRWNVTPAEAIEIQDRPRHLVVTGAGFSPIRRIGGVDVHFDRGGNRARARESPIASPATAAAEGLVLSPDPSCGPDQNRGAYEKHAEQSECVTYSAIKEIADRKQ
jgi:hypothetical protein